MMTTIRKIAQVRDSNKIAEKHLREIVDALRSLQ